MRELAPICEEARNNQNRGGVEHRNGLAKGTKGQRQLSRIESSCVKDVLGVIAPILLHNARDPKSCHGFMGLFHPQQSITKGSRY